MPNMEPYRRIPHDAMLGRTVIARHAYGFNARGGGLFKVRNVRGQVWSAADPMMIGSRRERVFWIADGRHYYAAPASALVDQCESELPSPVYGGMMDARCVGEPADIIDGAAACMECANELVAS